MLRVCNLTMRYPNGKLALVDFDLTVSAGELVVVLGGNGSGKTTLLRCVTRMLDPTGGEIWLDDVNLADLSGERLRRARLTAGDGLAAGQSGTAAQRPRQRCHRRARPPRRVLDGARRSSRCRAARRLRPISTRSVSPHSPNSAPAPYRAVRRSASRSPGRWRSVRRCCSPTSRWRASIPKRPTRSCASCAGSRPRTSLAVLCVLHQVELAYEYADRVVGIRDGRIVFDLPCVRPAARCGATAVSERGGVTAEASRAASRRTPAGAARSAWRCAC